MALPQDAGPSTGQEPEAERLARLAMTAASAIALQSTSHVAGICEPVASRTMQAHRFALYLLYPTAAPCNKQPTELRSTAGGCAHVTQHVNARSHTIHLPAACPPVLAAATTAWSDAQPHGPAAAASLACGREYPPDGPAACIATVFPSRFPATSASACQRHVAGNAETARQHGSERSLECCRACCDGR